MKARTPGLSAAGGTVCCVDAPALPPPLTLVSGPEELLADRAVRALTARVRGADPDADVRELVAAGLEPGTVTDLTSPSLFGERKVIVVRDLHDAGEALVRELKGLVASPAEDVHLVLVHKGGVRGLGLVDAARKAGAEEISCAEVRTRRDRLRFVKGEFASHRRKVTEDGAATLLDAIGNDLRGLAGACTQLAADSQGTIDADLVRRYYAGHADVSGFAVADKAVEGRAGEALEQLRWALHSGTDPVPIVSALAGSLRSIIRMAGAPRGLGKAELARELGMPPWKVDVVARQRRGWSPDGIAAALVAVAEADAQVKGGGADPVYALERVVVTVARLHGSS
jgi:DNA polymerase-3 subunit delta